MKRAIYCGQTGFSSFAFFNYGMTGNAWEESTGWRFALDGGSQPVVILREDIYIPSEDQQRHCPKP